MTLLTNDNTQMSFFYQELEPGECDEKEERIISFIEQESQLYEKALLNIVKRFHVQYRNDYIGRSIRHFKRQLNEAILSNIPLKVSIYPQECEAVYSLKLESVILGIGDFSIFKSFILYGSLIVYPENPDSFVHISTESSNMPMCFKVPRHIEFSLAKSGIFKDFLISSFLEMSAPDDERLVIVGKERCF